MTTATREREMPVVVTTAHRGVFFGYIKPEDVDAEILTIKKARLCVYWSADLKGFMGLAAMGPSAGCRIGPEADIRLRNITSVMQVTPAAAKRWHAAPWA